MLVLRNSCTDLYLFSLISFSFKAHHYMAKYVYVLQQNRVLLANQSYLRRLTWSVQYCIFSCWFVDIAYSVADLLTKTISSQCFCLSGSNNFWIFWTAGIPIKLLLDGKWWTAVLCTVFIVISVGLVDCSGVRLQHWNCLISVSCHRAELWLAGLAGGRLIGPSLPRPFLIVWRLFYNMSAWFIGGSLWTSHEKESGNRNGNENSIQNWIKATLGR